MLPDEIELYDYLCRCEEIFESDADWKYKYETIFGIGSKLIKPLLEKLGIHLEWYDPDADYSDDVKAYWKALKEVKDNIESTIRKDALRESFGRRRLVSPGPLKVSDRVVSLIKMIESLNIDEQFEAQRYLASTLKATQENTLFNFAYGVRSRM